ncbi:MAG TPA: hypothetical protein P5268_05830 [Candidatus Marinimicrobia bacterium]|nr:hypothetical protein [Candidatus Neomarinimicrobiota bacterium]HRS51024.1 hypothetical protein [Candidatus Neomarinimicrobiota bacterium]HRU92531.1 hypothetical protein [Candidatus Neomarinimicrobiota bacterium]
MKKLKFDVRDVFLTPRLALSGKKIWVHMLGLAAGWVIYTVLAYIALLVNGHSLAEIWAVYHFFPILCCTTIQLAWYSWLIYGIGVVAWVIIFLLASVAVARITYKQLKGDEFFSSGDSFKYIKKHGVAAVMGPVSILMIIAFFVILAIIAAWLAKWPVLDIIFLGIPYLLYFVVATFVVYTAVVFIVSLFLAPAIVGTAEEDTMETVFQSYSTLWSQPWRLVLYEGIVGGLTVVATFIYGWALILGYRFFNFVFSTSWLMDGKMSRIIEQASSYLFGINSPLTPLINRFFNVYTPASMGMVKPLCLGTTDIITVVLVTIALFIIAGTVVAYALSNFSVGQALIYIILRKKKDDEDLIERKDEDDLKEEEKTEEPTSEETKAPESETPSPDEKTE